MVAGWNELFARLFSRDRKAGFVSVDARNEFKSNISSEAMALEEASPVTTPEPLRNLTDECSTPEDAFNIPFQDDTRSVPSYISSHQ